MDSVKKDFPILILHRRRFLFLHMHNSYFITLDSPWHSIPPSHSRLSFLIFFHLSLPLMLFLHTCPPPPPCLSPLLIILLPHLRRCVIAGDRFLPRQLDREWAPNCRPVTDPSSLSSSWQSWTHPTGHLQVNSGVPSVRWEASLTPASPWPHPCMHFYWMIWQARAHGEQCSEIKADVIPQKSAPWLRPSLWLVWLNT